VDKKIINPVEAEKLDIHITEKKNRYDRIDMGANKIIDDYLSSEITIKEYNRNSSKQKQGKMFERER